MKQRFRVDGHPYWADAWSMDRRHALQQAAATAPDGEPQLITRYVDGHVVAEDPGSHSGP
ncbi:hypothetical protein [Streptomyces sp. NPDC047718]|uniref:hypothetical protein n=1 Tax=Streptomyces sp. NPDC047718 TaxID=3155479 RepID=UPI0033FCCF2E